MTKTLNNIIDSFQDFSTRHKQVNTFFSGQTWNFQSYTNKYSAVILIPIPSSVTRGRVTLMFNLLVIDQLNQDRSNKDEVLSDTLQILQDYVSEFADNEDTYGFTLNDAEEIAIEPLEEQMDDIVAGWAATISISLGYSMSTCIIPIESNIPLSTLTVTVSDPNTNLEGATVVLKLNGVTINTLDTDSLGQVVFEDLEYGNYTVDVTNSGYQDSLNNTITIDAETETLNIELSLITIFVVTVLDENSGYVLGANVVLKLNGVFVDSGFTDNVGQVAFNNLVYDDYTVDVTYTGYQDSLNNAITIDEIFEAMTIELSPVPVTSSVTFYVYDSISDLENAEVVLKLDGMAVKSGATGSNGEVTFTDVFYGDYTYNVSLSGYENIVDEPVTIDEPSEYINVELTPIPTVSTVIINVTDGSNPIEGAEVYFYDENVIVNLEGFTDANGQITFVNVPFGDYIYDVYCTGYEAVEGVGVTVDEVLEIINVELISTAPVYQSQYPPVFNSGYVKATTEFGGGGGAAYQACNYSNSLIGSFSGNAWLSNSKTNQRFNIDLGSEKTITRIYYENMHQSGSLTTAGVNEFAFYGSNDPNDFAETSYTAPNHWVQLTPEIDTFAEHVPADQADAKYIIVFNTTAYRYYSFKFADNHGYTDMDVMGVRRIELQLLA